MTEIRNAKIVGTMLGFEDHGIMTCMIDTRSGSLGQGFGGYCLGGKWGIEFIKALLKTLDVETWEQLKGTHCRLEADNGKIYRIGHIIENKWFDPKKDLKEFEEKRITNEINRTEN